MGRGEVDQPICQKRIRATIRTTGLVWPIKHSPATNSDPAKLEKYAKNQLRSMAQTVMRPASRVAGITARLDVTSSAPADTRDQAN